MLDKKTFAIGVLSLSAIVLIVANILAPRTASATYETTHDNDYSICTSTAPGGGDAIWITEKRSGGIAVFVYNPAQKTLQPMDSQLIQTVFAKAIKK